MIAITAKASRKMKKYAVLVRESRCFLGSFAFSWEQRKAKELFISTADKGYPDLPVLSATQDRGMIRRDENSINIFHDKKNEAGYKRVLPGQFVIHLRSFQGGFAHSSIEGITSPAYTVFGFSEPEKHDSEYWKYVFTSKSFIRRLETVTYGIRDGRSISYDEFLTLSFVYPSKAEQTAIARYLDKLSDLITLHQRKCAFLFKCFRTVISKKLVTSTLSWEQRRFFELYERVSRKNDLTYGRNDIISVANMYFKPDSYITDDSYLLTYNIFELGDIAFEGNKSKNYAHGRFVENTIGNGIVSHVFDVFKPIMNPYDLLFWKYAINNERLMGSVLLRSTKASTMMTNLVATDFLQESFLVPTYPEQQKIGAFFQQLDHLITLHQRECISFTGRAVRLIQVINKKQITSSWEQRKLGELVDRVVRKNTNNESTLPLTISAQYGLVDQITYFNNRVASRDVSNYYLVLNGEFAYNKSTSDGYPFGAVKRLDLYEKGVLSTLYIVFSPKKDQQIDSDFLTVFFDTDRWHKGVAERAAEGARNHGLLNISAEDFFDIDLSVPKDVAEQKQIGAFIRQLDHLITLHQRKPFFMKWRTSDANRNQTNRLVL